FLYTPLAFLPENVAAVVLLACNLGLLLGAGFLAAREVAERFGVRASAATLATLVLVGCFLTGDKLRGELQMWQTNALLQFLIVLSLCWLDRRPVLSGVALGLAFNIKYLPLVFLPYLILRRRWRTVAAFVVAIPAFAFLPAVLTGSEANLKNLAVAYSGIFRLLGSTVEVGEAANIFPLRSFLSISLTSAIARA